MNGDSFPESIYNENIFSWDFANYPSGGVLKLDKGKSRGATIAAVFYHNMSGLKPVSLRSDLL